MKTYNVTFRTPSEYASHNITAETPEAALAMAHKMYEDDCEDWGEVIDWERYDDAGSLEEISVRDEKGNELLEWLDGKLRQEMAASTMLEALTYWRDSVMSDYPVAERKGYVQEGLRKIDAAISKATGKAPVWKHLHKVEG